MAPPSAPCLITGIDYDATFVKKLDENAQGLIGCLGLENTSVLWDWYLKEGDTHDLIEEYISYRSARFGDTEKIIKDEDLKVKESDIAHVSEDHHLRRIYMGADCPTLSTPRVAPKLLATLATLWHACELIRLRPDIFQSSRISIEPHTLDPYDLLHAWKALAYFHRMVSRKRVPKRP
ncbi:uncharacterized protein BO87DRAFT_322440, partial [Aspergillus neoniger CBS 115656]